MLSSTFGILFYCSVVRKFRKTVHTLRERYAAFHEALPPLWNRSFAIRTWATLPYKCDQIVCVYMSRRRLYCCQSDRFATRPCMASVNDQVHFLMSRRRLFNSQNDRHATRPCVPVLCIEAVWVWLNTLCACLEGAHTIVKTIDTLMTAPVSFVHRIDGWDQDT